MCLGAPCTFLYMDVGLIGCELHVVHEVLYLTVTGERSWHDRTRERSRNSR